jgi:H+-translocating NAD(P) transhydrogenase subunit beta
MTKDSCPVRRVGGGEKNSFFGYYNKTNWDPQGRFLLGHRVEAMDFPLQPDSVTEVGFFDLDNGDLFHSCGRTTAWNWQMGSQLQWLGGADMPTVISLLNSYAGLSAAAMGFVLNSKLLIVAGSLDGASGFILSVIMSKAMNRSFTNVLFGAFGQVQTKAKGAEEAKTVRSATAEEAAAILSAANKVVIVPGYGMAVAQAQDKVRELFDALSKRGVDVRFGVHPVAGRMPGHMNVLLAEADIPYDRLMEMDDINSDLPQTDVALIIGANDVTNPAARTDTTSPIYGMPILDVDKARTVMVIKRSMNPGFAGIDNPLYYDDKTLMLFGDAKGFVSDIVRELHGGAGH